MKEEWHSQFPRIIYSSCYMLIFLVFPENWIFRHNCAISEYLCRNILVWFSSNPSNKSSEDLRRLIDDENHTSLPFLPIRRWRCSFMRHACGALSSRAMCRRNFFRTGFVRADTCSSRIVQEPLWYSSSCACRTFTSVSLVVNVRYLNLV